MSDDDCCHELAELQSEIQDAIEYLYRLSFKMRNASYRSLSTKVLSIKIGGRKDEIELFSSYAKFDHEYVMESLQQLRQTQRPLTEKLEPSKRNVNDNPPDFLLERVSRAITNRRRYVAYWQRHALKLSQADLVVSDKPKTERLQVGKEALALAHDQDQQPQAINPTTAPLVTDSETKTLLSATDVSQYQADLDDQLDAGTVISYATTAKDISGNSIDVPLPPVDAIPESEFVCPYCWVVCPSTPADARGWNMSGYTIDESGDASRSSIGTSFTNLKNIYIVITRSATQT
jgi:hypothetical protein